MNSNPSPLAPANDPAVTSHISLLQAIINRLANNSASCKTWCLTLVSALLSLSGATKNPAIATAALIPVVIFCFVDVMYLAQEKAYRALYNDVVTAIRNGSYGPGRVFDAKATRTSGHIWAALQSWSIWPIYGGLIAAYILAQSLGWLDRLAK
ncbi:hypothetical protein [Dongia sp.]|uniref:hypothetical protein n=1 Tax=Dongia sp. TaxID=1977262 RepID=UPI0035B11960